MKLEQLQAIAQEKKSGIMMMLALEAVRGKVARNVRGQAAPEASAPNRASLRAAKYSHSTESPYGHIYNGSVDPVEVTRRRAANKSARRARAIARKRG
jgi:hypothetical protein